ncbi:DgyrCDS9510 [Dimorphilus gyrociliatus]|uniref:DgyrCDS9510 n=1 Tax=Dimorphilus gyrociliatus TaxID=2664684 RepID=A0A7I8W2I3_9ANNE|nr:DgyrCDS9510 [Dimorphilus gyrociliatus]
MLLLHQPLNGFLGTLEKKIRNLDKRKTKLQGYQSKLDSGEVLEPEQKEAISHYGEVLGVIEFAKEMHKTYTEVLKDVAKIESDIERINDPMKSEPTTKKRESTASDDTSSESADSEQVIKLKTDAPLNEDVKFVLKIQDILLQLTMEETRTDLINGVNEAPQLSKRDVDALVRMYSLLSTERRIGKKYNDIISSASYHLIRIINKSPEQIPGLDVSYSYICKLLDKLAKSNYFDTLIPPMAPIQPIPPNPVDTELPDTKPAVIYGNESIYRCRENDPVEIVKAVQEGSFSFLQDSVFDSEKRADKTDGSIIIPTQGTNPPNDEMNSGATKSMDNNVRQQNTYKEAIEPSYMSTMEPLSINTAHSGFNAVSMPIRSAYSGTDTLVSTPDIPPPIPLPPGQAAQNTENSTTAQRITGKQSRFPSDKYRNISSTTYPQRYPNNTQASVGNVGYGMSTSYGSRNGVSRYRPPSTNNSNAVLSQYGKTNLQPRPTASSSFLGSRPSTGRSNATETSGSGHNHPISEVYF